MSITIYCIKNYDALIKRPVWRLEDGWALGFATKDRDGLAARLGAA